MKNLNQDFIFWFVGFLEGDGSLFKNKNSLNLDITQHSKDSQVLNYIKSNLGFGKIVLPKNRPNISMFVVYNPLYLTPLISLIESKFCTKRFISFVQNPVNPVKPTLDNYWLSGFIDAEGCFRIKIEQDGNIKLIFELSQKEYLVILNIKELFPNLKGNLRFDLTRDIWILSFSQKESRKQLIQYLSRFPLKSHKNVVFNKWLKAHRIMETPKEFKQEDWKLKIEKLSQDLNNWRNI